MIFPMKKQHINVFCMFHLTIVFTGLQVWVRVVFFCDFLMVPSQLVSLPPSGKILIVKHNYGYMNVF